VRAVVMEPGQHRAPIGDVNADDVAAGGVGLLNLNSKACARRAAQRG
jgi:hypothetical protein